MKIKKYENERVENVEIKSQQKVGVQMSNLKEKAIGKESKSKQAVHTQKKESPILTKAKGLQEKREGLDILKENEAKLITQANKLGISFDEYTKFIAANINVVMQVAERLHAVNKFKLYRLKYNRFEDYVKEEFDYTSSRAYQMIRAHEVASFINDKMGEKVIITEPQCRELLKLKVCNNDGTENEQATNRKRLSLVKKIQKDKGKVTTGLIANAVENFVKSQQKTKQSNKSLDDYKKDVRTSVNDMLHEYYNAAKASQWTDADKAELKAALIAELKEVLKSLQK